MNIHTTKGGLKLTELASTLYKPTSAHAPEPELTALDALREANPQLTKDKVIPEGTLIMVPEVPGYNYHAGVDPTQEMATAAARQLREVLGRVGDALETALAGQEKSDQETTQQLEKIMNDKAVLAQGKKVAERIKSINGATKQRARDIADQRSVQEEGIAQLKKDLAEFLQIHDR